MFRLKTLSSNNLSSSTILWHLCLGHALNRSVLQSRIMEATVPSAMKIPEGCEFYVKEKYRERYKGSLTNAVNIGHIHANTKSRSNTASESGEKYFVTVVDEYLWYMHDTPIRKKIDVSDAVQKFVRWVERKSDRTAQFLLTNAGTEFINLQEDLNREGTDI